MATLLSTVRKSGNVTLSGGSLTATFATTTGEVSTDRSCSGPTYCEWTVGASLTGTIALGLASNAFAFGTALLGTLTTGLGYDQTGAVKINAATIATIMTFAAGDRIGMAFNPLVDLIWLRKNNGNWNNDVIGNQNPVGNVGGISTATMGHFNGFYPAASATAVTPNQAVTAAFTTFTDTAPTGYVTVDTITASAVNPDLYAGPAMISSPSFGLTRSTFSGPPLYPASFYSTGTHVSGNVKEGLVNAVGKPVALYDKTTGKLLGTALTDASGNWSIDALGRTNVYAVALDPTTYRALAYDEVVPV